MSESTGLTITPSLELRNSNTLSPQHVDAAANPLDLLNIRSISPRPSESNKQQQQLWDENDAQLFDDPAQNLTVPDQGDAPDIDLIEPSLSFPPVMKQFQRKPSTRAWQFREILNDMKTGLFENPSREQLNELWAYVDKDNNGVLDRGEIISMIERYIELCQVVAKKQIQRHQKVMRHMAGRNHRRMSQTLGKLASKTQVVCNQWITKLHTNPDSLVTDLITDLSDGSAEWTKEQFYERAPQALRRLKEKLQMHEWAEKVAELANLDEEQRQMDAEEDMDDDKPNKTKKRLEGILTIKVVGALDLKPDEGRELCSPYCILHVGNKKLPTIYLNETNNPEWSQKFRFTRYRFKFGQSRQGTLYVMDWAGESTGASLVGFADFKIPDQYVEDAQQIELTLRDNNDKTRGYLTITLSLQPKRPEFFANEEEDGKAD